IEIRIFWQESNGVAAFHERTVASKDSCSSACRRSETKNNFQRRAFARTIRSEQSVNFACFDAEIEIADSRDRFSTKGACKNCRQSLNRDGCAHLPAATPCQLSHGRC